MYYDRSSMLSNQPFTDSGHLEAMREHAVSTDRSKTKANTRLLTDIILSKSAVTKVAANTVETQRDFRDIRNSLILSSQLNISR